MDLALTNYQIKDLFLQDNNFNVNDFVLDDFKRNLDATKNTKETYIKGVKVFLEWCDTNNITEVTHATLIQYKEDLMETKKASTISMYMTSLKKLYKYLETIKMKKLN